jgi:site-specific DNA-methyltransferase (adenine-specific)
MKSYYDNENGKIFYGDCIEILKNVPSDSVDLIITDPPYGTKTNQRDTFMVGEFSNIMPLILPELYRILKPDGGFYCFTSWSMMSDWLLRYQQYFKLQNIIVWDKQRHSGCYSSQSWQFTWEGIFFGIKGKRKIREYMPDVIKSNEKGKRIAMQKPVDIIEKLIIASSDEKQVILDPFIGSGSTLIACERTNRQYIGIEINKKYCDISIDRIEQNKTVFDGI